MRQGHGQGRGNVHKNNHTNKGTSTGYHGASPYGEGVVWRGHGQGHGEWDDDSDHGGVCVHVKDDFEADLMRQISQRQRRLRTLLKRDEDANMALERDV